MLWRYHEKRQLGAAHHNNKIMILNSFYRSSRLRHTSQTQTGRALAPGIFQTSHCSLAVPTVTTFEVFEGNTYILKYLNANIYNVRKT